MKGYYLGFPMKLARNSESETHVEKKIRHFWGHPVHS